jgi:hypothetical protein
MELLVALAAGILIGWVGSRLLDSPAPSPLGVGEIPARVRNVHATAHLDTGDFEVATLKRLSVDGCTTTYELFAPSVPFGGVLEGTTIHIGAQSARMNLARSAFKRGDSLTIFQPVGISDLAGGSLTT